MGFTTQEYWSGLPFLSLGDLSDPGIEPRSPDALPPGHQEVYLPRLKTPLVWEFPAAQWLGL